MTRLLAILTLISTSACVWEDAGDTGSDTGLTLSTGINPTIPPPDGYATPNLLRRGSEGLLIGSPGIGLDTGDYVMSVALSGDGRVAWFTTVNEFAPAGDQFRVFSMRTDGTEVHESDLVRPADAPWAPELFRVRTDQTGDTALLTQYTKDSQGRVIAQFAMAQRGSDFGVVATSNGEVEELGLAQDVYAELTDDGTGIVFTTGQRLWFVDALSAWVPFEIDQTDNLWWNNDNPPANATFRGLDINASGAEWITNVKLSDSDVGVVTGTSVATHGIEAVVDTDVYVGSQIDSAGEVVAYTLSPYASYVGEQGGTHRAVTVPVGDVRNLALADDGDVIHAGGDGSRLMPFFENVDGSGRVASLTPTWTTFGDLATPSGQLSDDGQVLLTRTPYPLAHHRGVDAFGAGVDAVFYRYGDEGELFLRAVVHTDEELVSVTVFPLLDDWMPPTAQYGYDEDPMYGMRFGQELYPVDGEPGHYEAVVVPRAEASLPFDSRYTLRVTVNQGSGNTILSAGYMDVKLF